MLPKLAVQVSFFTYTEWCILKLYKLTCCTMSLVQLHLQQMMRDGLPRLSSTTEGLAPQGPPGPSGTLNNSKRQQLKEEILAMLREEMGMLSCCNTSFLTVASTTSHAS